MEVQTIICLVIFVLTMASFLIGKVSMGITALISMVLLILTGCIDVTTALSGFANSNTIIMASMFIISAGFTKTQLVTTLSKKIAQIGKGSFTKIMIGYVLITWLIAQIVPSAMAVFSIVFPLALGVCKELNISPSKMMFSLGVVAISTVCTLPIGAGATYPSMYNGIIQQIYEAAGRSDYSQYGLFDIFLGRLPAMIFMIIYVIFVAPKFTPDNTVNRAEEMKAKVAAANAGEKAKLSKGQEITGYIVFFGVILGLIVTSLQLIKIPVYDLTTDTTTMQKLDTCIFPLIGAVVMVASGILKPKEAYVSLGLGGTVMMYVGVLALSSALSNTGAANLIGNAIGSLFGSNPNGYIVGLVFFIVPFILTQFMMNQGIINLFGPVAVMTCMSLGVSCLGPVLLVMIGALTAFMTPMATPSVGVFMTVGGYDQKTMFKMSWLPALCMCIINVIWVMTIFPL